jgi:hypothetical protein
MANTDKDTIYVDIDDEITGIIDKVKSSNGKVVALVLPKRANVFQSIVNMKLLKRAVDADKKNVVLITSEAGLLPLAGAAGIHVAKTLNTRPEIPSGPTTIPDNDEEVDEDASLDPDDENPLDQNSPVGRLAGAGAASALPAAAAADGVETLAFDNEEPAPALADKAADAAKRGSDKAKTPKSKKLKVPNFNRFRLILIILVVALIVLIGGFIFLRSKLDKATIHITTNATNVDTNLNLTLASSDSSLSVANDSLPSKYQAQNKTYSQTVNTTGQKNEGDEATGTVNMTAQYCGSIPSSNPDVPAGTGVSANGQTFITQQDTQFSTQNVKNNCINYQATTSTSITAQAPGSAYNVSGVNFTVAGSYGGYTVSASGSASGGTDNIVQTVNQNDINNAKAKITTGSSSSAESGLESELKGSNYYPLTATFQTGSTNTSTSAGVGQAASSVTVNESITYSMFGVIENNLKKLVNNSIDGQIDTSKQSILDDGISTANYTIDNLTASGGQLSMAVKAVAGPELNIAQIKKNAEGLKAGDISTQLQTDPDVNSVKVDFSPFWVSSAPKNTSKITVDVAKPSNK